MPDDYQRMERRLRDREAEDRDRKAQELSYEQGIRDKGIDAKLTKHDDCLEEIKESQRDGVLRLDTVEKAVTRILILAEAAGVQRNTQVSARQYWSGVGLAILALVATRV